MAETQRRLIARISLRAMLSGPLISLFASAIFSSSERCLARPSTMFMYPYCISLKHRTKAIMPAKLATRMSSISHPTGFDSAETIDAALMMNPKTLPMANHFEALACIALVMYSPIKLSRSVFMSLNRYSVELFQPISTLPEPTPVLRAGQACVFFVSQF